MRLVLATTNRGKLDEIQQLLAGLALDLRTLADYPPVEPPEETGATFAENATLKALFYARHTGELTVAEDSGLAIDALGGAPGVHSARFGGDISYPERFALLRRQLAAAGAPTSRARFVCALVLADGDRVVFQSHGTVEGQVAETPRGSGGFGYDPIFFYPPFGCTLAEAGDRKSSVSHRANAFGALKDFMTGDWRPERRGRLQPAQDP